jgi:hypothetical protein
MLAFTGEFRHLCHGIFKVAIFGQNTFQSTTFPSTNLYRLIHLEKDESRNAWSLDVDRSTVENFLHDQPQWNAVRAEIFNRLDQSSTFNERVLFMRLIETATIPSTRHAMERFIEGIPSSLVPVYNHVLELEPRSFPFRVSDLLRWIVGSTRPLDVGELAVVTAVLTPGADSMDRLRDRIPLAMERYPSSRKHTLKDFWLICLLDQRFAAMAPK